jgi:Lrp/AsnC family transcriptional regulator
MLLLFCPVIANHKKTRLQISASICGEKNFVLGYISCYFSKNFLSSERFSMSKPEFRPDATDVKILELLQADASQPVADIARKVGLSVTPCWRRIQKMEESGIIRGRVALLNAPAIGLGMSVFVAIRTDQHNADWLDNFARRIAERPEVVEFYRMSGEVDYMLRVVVEDMAAYDRFYKQLIAEVRLKDVSSSFAMEEIKYTTALPLPEAV